MQAGADQRHLLIKGLQQAIELALPQAAPQELGALAEQPPIAAQQLGVHRLQLEHHPIEPLAPQRRLPAHQLEIQGAEAHAAQGADQLVLPLEQLAVAAGQASALAPQLQLQTITTSAVSSHPALALTPADQIPIGAAAMGAQAAEQLHRLQQVGFALPVAADHQQPRGLQLEGQRLDIAELAQLQAMQPNGSGAL